VPTVAVTERDLIIERIQRSYQNDPDRRKLGINWLGMAVSKIGITALAVAGRNGIRPRHPPAIVGIRCARETGGMSCVDTGSSASMILSVGRRMLVNFLAA
jgi:hypothetical protein